MKMNTPQKPYDVGYGRPPEASKWKKGECGNPRRIRNRKPKPVTDLIDELLARKITVEENGLTTRRTGFEIISLQLSNKAAAGDARALKILVKYSDFAAARNPASGMIVVRVDDNGNPIPRNKK